MTWNGLVHFIDFYCNIVIAFETSLFFPAKLLFLIIFSLMIHNLLIYSSGGLLVSLSLSAILSAALLSFHSSLDYHSDTWSFG